MSNSRRSFIKSTSAALAAGVVLPSSLTASSPRGVPNIVANDDLDTVVGCSRRRKVDFRLSRLQDDKTVLRNPNKGFYWHYIDNGYYRGAYRDKHDIENDDMSDFPGFNHLYLRVDWSDLEPQEGKFNWKIIDDIRAIWEPRGYGWSCRVCCCENSPRQPFATPEWVMKAGANGVWLRGGPGVGHWGPDYNDPIFLKKLDNFLKALAARYDGSPTFELMDIGTYGNWGEGHVVMSGQKDWPMEVMKKHIDLHVKHFRKTPVIVNDDILIRSGNGYNMEERNEMIEFALMRGVGIRDDSICVPGVIESQYTSYDTTRDSSIYAPFAAQQVVDCELDHYTMYAAPYNPPGSPAVTSTRDIEKNKQYYAGGLKFIEACRTMMATFVGFHAYPRHWLPENPYVAEYLANRAGYWYIPDTASLPEYLVPGIPSMVYMDMDNRGFARPYYEHKVRLFLSGEGNLYELPVESAGDNRLWLPGKISRQMVRFYVPENIKPGKYRFEYGLVKGDRPILLGLDQKLKTVRNTYSIAEIEVRNYHI